MLRRVHKEPAAATEQQQQQADIEQVTIEMGVMRNELAAQETDEAKQNMFLIYYHKEGQM